MYCNRGASLLASLTNDILTKEQLMPYYYVFYTNYLPGFPRVGFSARFLAIKKKSVFCDTDTDASPL